MVLSLTHLISYIKFCSCTAEMILDSVGKCDVDVRRDLYSGIILTGTTPYLQSQCCPSQFVCHLISAESAVHNTPRSM